MAFDFGSVISDGVDRVFTRAGAMAIGIHTAIYSVLVTGLIVGYVVFDYQLVAVPVILPVVAVGVLLTWVALALAYVGTARWLLRDDRSTAPRSALTRRAVLATVTILTLNVGFGLVVVVSTLFFWLPSFAIGTVLIFAPLVVAVEDAGPIEAITRSWALTEGHRIELFAIGLLYNGAFWGASRALDIVVIIPILGWVALGAFWAAQTVFSVGILAEAYSQITAEPRPA